MSVFTWRKTPQVIISCDSILPVESIGHLNGDQHRQGHGHGSAMLKDRALDSGEVLILRAALHEVGLYRGEGGYLVTACKCV